VIQTTYSDLRRNLRRYLDEVVDDCEEVLVKGRGGRDVVLVDAREYASMKETLHVLTPIENAKGLIEAFEQSDRGEGIEMTVDELRSWVESGAPLPPKVAEPLRKQDHRRSA
jgi:antitoxin YefM